MNINLAAIAITLVLQGIPRTESATPITSADPVTRVSEDKLQKVLEEQNIKEMTTGKPPAPPNKHEMAMLLEMEMQLKKMTEAAATNTYKEINSQAGKLISGIRFFVPVVEAEAAPPIPVGGLQAALSKLVPRVESVIKSIRGGVIRLNETKGVLSQLRSIQQATKTKSR